MKVIIALLLFVSVGYAQESFSLEVTIFGVSFHEDRDLDWNETNPGIGLSLIYHDEEDADIVFSVGRYEDSYNETAEYALLGLRKIFGDRNSFFLGCKCSCWIF